MVRPGSADATSRTRGDCRRLCRLQHQSHQRGRDRQPAKRPQDDAGWRPVRPHDRGPEPPEQERLWDVISRSAPTERMSECVTSICSPGVPSGPNPRVLYDQRAPMLWDAPRAGRHRSLAATIRFSLRHSRGRSPTLRGVAIRTPATGSRGHDRWSSDTAIEPHVVPDRDGRRHRALPSHSVPAREGVARSINQLLDTSAPPAGIAVVE